MRTLLVLPAVTIPVALAAVWAASRQIADATRALIAEVERLGQLGDELTGLRHDLAALDTYRARVRTPHH